MPISLEQARAERAGRNAGEQAASFGKVVEALAPLEVWVKIAEEAKLPEDVICHARRERDRLRAAAKELARLIRNNLQLAQLAPAVEQQDRLDEQLANEADKAYKEDK